MHDPNNQFQITWDSGYAYPPQIKPIFYQQAWELASHLRESQALVDTPFPRGIFVKLIPRANEEPNLRRWNVDAKNRCLWVTLKVSGDGLWDAADTNQMEPEVRRIIKKILTLVFVKYKLDLGLTQKW